TVLGPRRAAERDDTPRAAEQGIGGRIELALPCRRRTDAGPRENRVRGAVVLVVTQRLQYDEVVRVLTPSEAEVARRRRIEHPQRAGRGIEQLHAVAGAVLGGDGDREEATLRLPRG